LVIVSKGNGIGASASSSTNTNALHPGSPEVHTVIDLHNPQLHPRQLAYDSKRNGIWFWTSLLEGDDGCENQVYFYDIQQQRLASWPIYSGDWSSQLLSGIAVAPNGDVWIGWNDNLVRFQPSTGNSTRYALPAQARYPLPAAVIGDLPADLGIADLAITQNGTIWIARYAALSLTTFDPATQAFQEYPLPSTAGDPAKLAIGPDGHVFFTTNLSAVHPGHAAEMTGEFAPESRSTVVYPQSAQALTITPTGDLYTAGPTTDSSQGPSLARMPATTRAAALQQRSLPTFEQATVPLAVADRSLAADVHGRVWMAISGEPKIAVFDPATGKLQQYSYPVPSTIQYISVPYAPGAPSASPVDTIPITPIAAMVTDEQGHLWFIRDLSDQIEEVVA
jgi:streptogramin lyase